MYSFRKIFVEFQQKIQISFFPIDKSKINLQRFKKPISQDFNCQKGRKSSKNCHIYIVWFQFLAKNVMER